MNKTWLIIDSNYIARRALHSMKGLTHGDVRTGVLFGFFKDVEALQKQFSTPHVIFCFDYGKGLRKEFFPEYKIKRSKKKKELTGEEKEIESEFRKHENLLRKKILPKLGYSNVFYQDGYEGDDVVASVTKNLPEGDEAIMVTSDKDLLQLVTKRVTFYNPQTMKMTTIQSFKKEYGIESKDWWKVKALGGCTTDEVPGVPKVGEGTALKYLRGELPKHYVTYKNIKSKEGIAIRKRNVRLVRLPYPNTQIFELREDNLCPKKWKSFAKAFGFASMLKKKQVRTPRKGLIK